MPTQAALLLNPTRLRDTAVTHKKDHRRHQPPSVFGGAVLLPVFKYSVHPEVLLAGDVPDLQEGGCLLSGRYTPPTKPLPWEEFLMQDLPIHCAGTRAERREPRSGPKSLTGWCITGIRDMAPPLSDPCSSGAVRENWNSQSNSLAPPVGLPHVGPISPDCTAVPSCRCRRISVV
jgi:hypothetical protein